MLLLIGPLLWPWHSAVDQELLLLLLPELRHISAAPPAEATWITNDVVMGVFVVCQVGFVSDAVVVAVAILTTTIACTFEPLWSCTDLGHMPESSAPFALVHAAHWRIRRGWRLLLVPPSSVRTRIKWPPDPPFGRCVMRGMMRLSLLLLLLNVLLLIRLLLSINIFLLLLLLLLERLLPHLLLLMERLLPHLPTAMLRQLLIPPLRPLLLLSASTLLLPTPSTTRPTTTLPLAPTAPAAQTTTDSKCKGGRLSLPVAAPSPLLPEIACPGHYTCDLRTKPGPFLPLRSEIY